MNSGGDIMARRKFLGKKAIYRVCASLLLLFLTAFPAFAQEYPSRPVKIIVPYPPGGVTDLISRSQADAMAKVLGQPVFIENKPGGGTSLAYSLVASSKPDGYTIGHLALGSLVGNYLAYDVSYNPLKSFAYIGEVGIYAQSIIVKANAPWKTWDEFIEYSKKHPNEIRMGFTNPVSTNSIPTKWINKQLGHLWKEIAFDGDPPCISALLGGHIEAFPGGGAHNILVKDGRARILLALTSDPIPNYPNAPTFKQIYGIDINNIAGYLAPAGIPAPILKKLEKAAYEATKAPEFLTVMDKMAMTPAWRNSQELEQEVKNLISNFQMFLKDLDKLKKKE
jgi:tripartite-type tricarboxylate transporter receptor subunit TctC